MEDDDIELLVARAVDALERIAAASEAKAVTDTIGMGVASTIGALLESFFMTPKPADKDVLQVDVPTFDDPTTDDPDPCDTCTRDRAPEEVDACKHCGPPAWESWIGPDPEEVEP